MISRPKSKPSSVAEPDCPNQGHAAVYEASAQAWAEERKSRFPERDLLQSLLEKLPQGASVLDLGCGTGVPIARFFHEAGCRVTGIDFAPAMLAIARKHCPEVEFLRGDMRDLDLGRRFEAIIAWDSLFHLTEVEQRRLIPKIAAHLSPQGWLLFTCGPDAGEAWGRVAGGPVYHASLSPAGYAQAFEAAGMIARAFGAALPSLAGRSYWLVQARG